MKKKLMSALAAGLLTVSAVAVPIAAQAQPVEFEHYSGTNSFDTDECGFPAHVDVTFEGLFMLKENKDGGPALLMDNYHVVETGTANGRTLTIEHQGMIKETSFELVEGTIYQVEVMEAGQPFVMSDENGTVFLRDRGLLRWTYQVDTADPDPANWVEVEGSFEILADHGSHPGFYFDFCAALEEYFFG
ncbi:hypothetical protein [Mycetocola sp. 2940]|uniref:hypothetical protein n=1 Tax=Mycetocola sp. 2940 TaxID=3156452 RepID=UPI0033946708